VLGHTATLAPKASGGLDVTTTAPSSVPDSSWQAHEQEARLLGELLRTSRLALLFGEAGSDKTALLKHGLMPMLHRRTSDRGAKSARNSGVVVPFADRRNRSRAPNRKRELVVYFDDWSDAPLEALHARIQLAAATSPAERAAPRPRLAQDLAALCNRLDATFIILLDHFEQFLKAPPQREDMAEFANELVEAVNQAGLPANFLISLDEEARPWLGALRRRIPGFDDFSLKLAGPTSARLAAPSAPPEPVVIEYPSSLLETLLESDSEPPLLDEVVVVSDPPAVSPPQTSTASDAVVDAGTPKPKSKRRAATPPAPIKTEDVYAFIEATLANTPTEIASEPFLPSRPIGRSRTGRGRTPEPGSDTAAATDGLAAAPPTGVGFEPAAPARSAKLDAAVKWVRRRLRKPAP